MHKAMSRDDLLTRNPGHSFTETVDGALIFVDFKDDQDRIVARARAMDIDEAYAAIREQMGIGPEVPALLTTVQRDALTEPEKVGIIANTTTRTLNVYIGGAWR